MKYAIIACSAALVVLSFLSVLVFGIVMMVETSTGPGCPSVSGSDDRCTASTVTLVGFVVSIVLCVLCTCVSVISMGSVGGGGGIFSGDE